MLYDVQERRSLGSLSVSGVKYVAWSSDMSSVALMSKRGTRALLMCCGIAHDGVAHTGCRLCARRGRPWRTEIKLCDRKLAHLCTIQEYASVKSGAWQEDGVFVFTTPNHIKYALPNGDTGIIRTLDIPIYITRVKGNHVYCLDREAHPRVLSIDPTEFKFKLALITHRYEEVLLMVRSANLIGQSIIAYLQQKGHPEVALHFVKDEQTRFDLALQCGNIEVALAAARVLDKKRCWEQLADAALSQGNHQVIEMAYQRIKDFERLSFLYFITGNRDKLRKMMKIAELRGEPSSQLHNALYLGDMGEVVRLLTAANQCTCTVACAGAAPRAAVRDACSEHRLRAVVGATVPLAYAAARTYGLDEEADRIAAIAGREAQEAPVVPKREALLLQPPMPLLRTYLANWPLLTVSRGFFDNLAISAAGSAGGLGSALAADSAAAVEAVAAGGGESGWDEELNLDQTGPGTAATVADGADDVAAAADAAKGGGWEEEPLEIPPELVQSLSAAGADGTAEGDFFAPPARGVPLAQVWCTNSPLAVDHVAGGSFDTALQILRTQVGAVSIAPLRPLFLAIYQAARASLPCMPNVASLLVGLQRNWKDAGSRNGLPALCTRLEHLVATLQSGYLSTTGGKFAEAVQSFRRTLHWLCLLVVDSRQEVGEAAQILDICRNYIVGLSLEMARKELPKDTEEGVQRSCEWAAYFTHCRLEPVHLVLALRTAMTVAFKSKNFKLAASMGRRLLELGPRPELAQQARQVVQVCEKQPVDQHRLRYDEHNPFTVCPLSHVPVYKGTASTRCPLCLAIYVPEHKGKLCAVCLVAEIGRDAPGLQFIWTPQHAR